jgi:hypothetical protein
MNGNLWWKVVYEHDELLNGIVIAMFSDEYMGQAEMWARLVADQMNRGRK